MSRLEIAWLLGIIQGDGYVGRYFVEISDMYRENLEVVASTIADLGFRAVIKKDPRENRYRLWINSVEFVNLIKSYGLTSEELVPCVIRGGLVEPYIRGLYDAEGYIEYWKPRKCVRINFAYEYSEVVDFITRHLRERGIHTYTRYSSRVYRVQIYRRQDVLRFIDEIGFSYPVKKKRLSDLLGITP
jgi:intein-encoded DNA endonuclease-like protein